MAQPLQQQFHTALAEARYRLHTGLSLSVPLLARVAAEGESIESLTRINQQEKATHG